MLISLIIIAAMVNIIAKNHNYNIKIEKNPNFDIRVRRDIENTEETDILKTINDLGDKEVIKVLDGLEKILKELQDIEDKYPSDKDVQENVEIKNTSGKNIKDFKRNLNTNNYEDIKDTNFNIGDNIEVKYDTEDEHDTVSKDFDETTKGSIDESSATAEFIRQLRNTVNEIKSTVKSNEKDLTKPNLDNEVLKNVIDIVKRDKFKKDALSVNNLDKIVISLKELQDPDTIFSNIVETFRNFDEPLATTESIDKIESIIKELQHSGDKTEESDEHVQDRKVERRNLENHELQNHVSIIDILKKDRFKREASSKNAITNFFSNIYNKVYNLTHSETNQNIDNKNFNNNYQYYYNQRNNNDNNIEKNQAYQYYNSFNQFNQTAYNNQNNINYNNYQYPMYTPYNNTYNNQNYNSYQYPINSPYMYNNSANLDYNGYRYNYGYNNQYNYNNQPSNPSNDNTNNPTGYRYNSTDVNGDNDNISTSTEVVIVSGCILCPYIGCPKYYKRIGFMCVRG